MGERSGAAMEQLNTTVAGIVAHVDAGKTTLAESLLYLTGETRRLGRVDHKDAFLDTHALEKDRGITIFSKQAQLKLQQRNLTLLDTPGHVDFSAEMERTLSVLDYAILVISVADGVSGHVQTLWRLLKQYRIPVFLFINKMDQQGADAEAALAELQKRLDERCVAFHGAGILGPDTENVFYEKLAETDELLLEQFLESGRIQEETIRSQIAERKLFPCYFGSALKVEGVQEFLEGFERYTKIKSYGTEFGARVFKIARDHQGKRLTYLKVTGGVLRSKQMILEEKTDQLRIYNGAGFVPVNEVRAGMVCAVTGLTKTVAGQGLGRETDVVAPVLEPVLTYCIRFDPEIDVHEMYRRLQAIEEEEPQLHLVWQEETGEIHAQVMGEVQVEILQSLIRERFGVEAAFTSGSIIYRETITNTVEGIGHFEPLRHYAEVHLLLEPGEPGSGVVCEARCSEDLLAKNWQRLILTHLEEKRHKGVLTGAELTDVRITLIAGRAHIKHTEGGDFRQATYRAVRQGLMQAKSCLLEPYYAYRLEIPAQSVGRAMTDIEQMCGTFQAPEQEGEQCILSGMAPVSEMRGYQKAVTAYTRGTGRLFCTLKGYYPCHNQQQIVEAACYDPEADLANTPDSVFCAHGAGFVVPWYEVPQYMHIEGTEQADEEEMLQLAAQAAQAKAQPRPRSLQEYEAENDELKAIFERTYGPVKPRYREEDAENWQSTTPKAAKPYKPAKKQKEMDEYLLVDGYNVIFGWPELNELAKMDINAARLALMDILSNYQGYSKCHLILVFDAYKVSGGKGSVEKYHNIHVVYTREAETADQYIEKTVHEMGRKHHVTVATSDGLEQVIILGQGGNRLSAAGLKALVENAGKAIREACETTGDSGKVYLFHETSDEMKAHLEQLRLQKNHDKERK